MLVKIAERNSTQVPIEPNSCYFRCNSSNVSSYDEKQLNKIVISCFIAMLLLLLVFAFGFIIQVECADRKASLVILPPLVLGYEEISYSYEDRDQDIPHKIVKELKDGDGRPED